MNESEPIDEVSKIEIVIKTGEYVEFLRINRRRTCVSAFVITGI